MDGTARGRPPSPHLDGRSWQQHHLAAIQDGRSCFDPGGVSTQAALEATPRRSPVVLLSTDSKPWTENGFRSSWRKACKKAGVVGVTFNDLRDGCHATLAIAGCTEAEITAITGHTLRDVRSILYAHYLHRDPALAEAAIRKLEARTNSPKWAPNRADCL